MDRRIVAKRWTLRRVALAAAVLLAGSAAAFAYLRYALTNTLIIQRDKVTLATVRSGAFQDYIPITGNVEPRGTVYLDAVDGGQVMEVMAEEGARVVVGAPLVRLSNTNLQLQVINSEAQVSEQLDRLTSTRLLFEQTRLQHSRELIDVRFHIQQSDMRLGRIVALTDTGTVKRSDIEDVRAELDRLRSLESAVARARAVDRTLQTEQIAQLDRTAARLNKNLELARQNLENLVIKAPFDGQLTVLDAHLGQSKAPGQRIGQIDRTDGFKVAAFVDEHYLSRVSVGQPATVEIDNRRHRLQVSKVYPDVRDRQFRIDLIFVGRVLDTMRRGQTLQLQLENGAEQSGLLIDNGPFYDVSGGQWMFVLSGSGAEAERRPLRLGRRNPKAVEVLAGLSPGERVIVSSYETFEDIDRIRLR